MKPRARRSVFERVRQELRAALVDAEGGSHVYIPDHVDPTTGGRNVEYLRVARVLAYLGARAQRI